MIDFFKNNLLVILKGFLLTVGLLLCLMRIGFVNIDPRAYFENALVFVIWWSFISGVIYSIPYFVKNKFLVAKVIGLVILLVVAIIADGYWSDTVNPFTFPLIVVFWLGVIYLLMPRFFNKYRWLILPVYGIILFYFLLARMSVSYLQIHHDRVINFLLAPVPVLFLMWVYEQWKAVQTLKSEKGRAELALLKSQINPHFIFNTLNNLYGLTVEKNEMAPEVVLKLSDMLRYTIYEAKDDFVKIEDEIAYLENYIELHRIRYQKEVKIRFNHQVDQSCEVAPLLFIILLENAFKHGVESIARSAYIDLFLRVENSQVHFNIENNFESKPNQTQAGIGLDNLKKRLEYIYPGKHKLFMDESASVYEASLNIELI